MSPKGETMPERMASAEQWIKDHERRCDLRYAGIQQSVTDMRGTLRGASRIGIGVLLSLIAWLAAQVWNGVQANGADDRARIATLEQRQSPVTVYQSQTPAAKPAR